MMKFTKAKNIIKRLFLFGAIWLLLHVGFIVYDGLTDEALSADYAVVLGNKVELNGEPSLRLQIRLDKGLELYEKGLVKQVIVSGGLGKEGFEEAEVMKAYLEKKGIPETAIIADTEGYTSYLTAKNAKDIIQNVDKKVIVVSHYYHISRTKLAFQKFGFKTVYGAHADVNMEWREPYAIFREFVAYYYYLIRSYS